MSSEDHIKELCARVVAAAADDADFSVAIEALKAALHKHSEDVRAMAVAALLLADLQHDGKCDQKGRRDIERD